MYSTTDEWIKEIIYSGVSFSHKEELTIWFEGKWMQLEDIMLNEASQAQKDKECMFSFIYGRQTQYKFKQYYEKQVTQRGGH
jgi:hypothetical protein